MTNQELFEEFDILYNSICSNQAPGLNDYEKSVLLTQAQEELIKECYSGQTTSFELNEAIRRSIEAVVKFSSISPTKETSPIKGTVYNLPEDLWVITYEDVKIISPCKCLNDKEIQVVPTTQDEFNRIKNNPFRGPNRSRVLRLDIGENKVALVSSYPLGQYTIGYIVKPRPIILFDLEGGLTIDGYDKESSCMLNSYTHRFILERAVNKAASIYRQ